MILFNENPIPNIWLFMLTFGLAFGMVGGAGAVNASIPMINAVGLGNLGQSSPSLYSINNMAASLLAQSKFFGGSPNINIKSTQTNIIQPNYNRC